MKILGIETATRFGGVALIDETRLIAEYRLSLESRHTEKLLPMIDTLLKETDTSLSDLSAIAVSIGPGSFTGLRVGLATAKGLAIGSGLPLLPIQTLEAMALPFRYLRAAVLPMITARKDEVYWALFKPHEDICVRCHPDSAGSIEEALSKIGPEKELLFVGEAAIRNRDQIINVFKGHALFPPAGLALPLPFSVAELGHSMFILGKVIPAEEILPRYLSVFEPKVMERGGR